MNVLRLNLMGFISMVNHFQNCLKFKSILKTILRNKIISLICNLLKLNLIKKEQKLLLWMMLNKKTEEDMMDVIIKIIVVEIEMIEEVEEIIIVVILEMIIEEILIEKK